MSACESCGSAGLCVPLVVRCDPEHVDDEALKEPAKRLAAGELVAFPTETVYGLGANAKIAEAVAAIFEVKGRPQDNPLIVHIGDTWQLEQLTPIPIPEAAKKLADAFWPGPLTLVLPRLPGAVPDCVTASLPTLAVRMPSHPVARRLLQLAKVPVAAPSANLSGRPSPTTAEHVIHDLGRSTRVAAIIDGGACGFGVESTVVDVQCAACGGLPIILRPGGVTLEQLREVLPNIQVYSAAVFGTAMQQRPSTPGMKYRHYAPSAPVTCWEKSGVADRFVSDKLVDKVHADLTSSVKEHSYKHIGIIITHKGQDSWKWDSLAATLGPDVKVELFPIGDERTDPQPDAVEHKVRVVPLVAHRRHADVGDRPALLFEVFPDRLLERIAGKVRRHQKLPVPDRFHLLLLSVQR